MLAIIFLYVVIFAEFLLKALVVLEEYSVNSYLSCALEIFCIVVCHYCLIGLCTDPFKTYTKELRVRLCQVHFCRNEHLVKQIPQVVFVKNLAQKIAYRLRLQTAVSIGQQTACIYRV